MAKSKSSLHHHHNKAAQQRQLDVATGLSGVGVDAGLISNTAHTFLSAGSATTGNLNVEKVNANELEINANKVLLTFDMDYVHNMLDKCTMEHIDLLLKHLDQIKLQIEKKVFEKR